jgi:nucleotide-binding universal stress UspA family protein
MYTVVLAVGDDEDRALDQADFVSRLPNAESEIDVHVVHTLHGEEREVPEAMRRADRVASVRRAMEYLEDRDVAITAQDISEPIAESIIDLADDLDADLIVMGGRKRSPTAKAVLGSVTQQVILNTNRAVTVAGQRVD